MASLDRTQHLAFCVHKARETLGAGNSMLAVVELVARLRRHPATADRVKSVGEYEMIQIANGPKEGIEKFIASFEP